MNSAMGVRCAAGILAALAAVIVGLDQWTKWLTVTHIPSTNGSAVVRAIPGFFHITHIKNTGAAWSMLEGQTWLFVLVTAAFFVIVGVLIWKKVLQKPISPAVQTTISIIPFLLPRNLIILKPWSPQ